MTRWNDADTAPHQPTAAARTLSQWQQDVRNTLRVEPERRVIDVFCGLEFNNPSFERLGCQANLWPMYLQHGQAAVPAGFRTRCMRGHRSLAMRQLGSTEFEHLSSAQGVQYILRIHNDKTELARTLQQRDAFVVYLAHARYGRGPCFGPGLMRRHATDTTYLGEDWQFGEQNNRGIFRMGYPCVGVPAYEIMAHQYRARLRRVSAGRPRARDCDSLMRRRGLRGLQAMSLDRLQAELVSNSRAHDTDIRNWVIGGAAAGDVWVYWAHSHEGDAWHVVHDAGYDELRNAAPQCRVFCHLGCNSKLNRPIWVRRMSLQPHGDHGYSMWTSQTSYWNTSLFFLYRLLAYPRRSAGRRWRNWLRHARRRANNDIAMDRHRYRIIDHNGDP